MKLKSDTQSRYTPDAGAHDQQEGIYCGVCGDQMTVKFGINGPTGSAESMAGHKHLHDRYMCPHRDEDWHQQVVALRMERKNSASAMIGEILEKEADLVLEQREATKKVNCKF